MAGFWSGFAQGWQAESDRIEKRKMFEEELKLRKEETLLSLVPKYAAARMGGSGGEGGGGATGSIAHYEGMLADLGMDPDHIARISAEGGAKALSEVSNFILSDKDREYPWTPEEINRVGELARIRVTKGGTVNIDDLATQIGLDPAKISPEIRFGAELAGTTPTTVEVGIPFQRTRPVGTEEISRAEQALNTRLRSQLAAEERRLQKLVRDNPEGAAEYADRLAQVSEALEEAKADNPVGALDLMPPDFGPMIMQGVLSNNPRLKEVDLGVWEPIKQAVLKPPAPERTTAFPTPNAQHIAALQADPSLAELFDEKFGPGASQRYLN